MCIVSYIGNDFGSKWDDTFTSNKIFTSNDSQKTNEEYLKDMVTLLREGKLYDSIKGEPDCEHGDKVKTFREACEQSGVDDSGVFSNEKTNELSDGKYVIIEYDFPSKDKVQIVGRFDELRVAKQFVAYINSYNASNYSMKTRIEILMTVED